MQRDEKRYEISFAIPSVETYRDLRRVAGLSEKSQAAAEAGLPNTLFAVQILCDGAPIGMGRVVGDGGSFYQVVDIAVRPEHQGKGVGKKIMAEIAAYLQASVPETGYVSLLADGEAYRLYEQYGFKLTAPASVGMGYKQGPRGE